MNEISKLLKYSKELGKNSYGKQNHDGTYVSFPEQDKEFQVFIDKILMNYGAVDGGEIVRQLCKSWINGFDEEADRQESLNT